MVYMNSVSMVCVSKSITTHACIEQAKFFRYSLRSIYEQPNIHVIHKQTNNLYDIIWLSECLFV